LTIAQETKNADSPRQRVWNPCAEVPRRRLPSLGGIHNANLTAPAIRRPGAVTRQDRQWLVIGRSIRPFAGKFHDQEAGEVGGSFIHDEREPVAIRVTCGGQAAD
jgi:hypothetical protein